MSLHSISASVAWTAAGWTMLHLIWIGAAGGIGGGRRCAGSSAGHGRRSATGRRSPACWP